MEPACPEARSRTGTLKRSLAALVAVAALLAGGRDTVRAQVADLPQLLTGTWDGAIEGPIRGDRARRLVIVAVREEEGKWVARARFGLPAHMTGTNGGFAIPVAVAGSDVWLDFTTPGAAGGNHVSLKLEGQTVLRGTIKFTQGNAQKPWAMRLQKVSNP